MSARRVRGIVGHLTSAAELSPGGTKIKKLLVANRGEIAMRICRAAADCGLETVTIFSIDDAKCLHVKAGDTAVEIPGFGAQAYLNAGAIVQAAIDNQCEAIHPGYGFLSENEHFARLCGEQGIIFVGPVPETLKLFGNKLLAKNFARTCNVECLPGLEGNLSVAEITNFLQELDGESNRIIIKAVAGGGGRGMRVVEQIEEIENAVTRCRSEAGKSFGNDSIFVEKFIPLAKHIEVQIIGDGKHYQAFGERECSVQRQNQKLIEIAPSPTLTPKVRTDLVAAALRMAEKSGYVGVGTVEFLYDIQTGNVYFIEVNPRLQVEHTVTEEVFNIDLVVAQLRISQGEFLPEIFPVAPTPDGYAIQVRVNMERMRNDGTAIPSSGCIRVLEMPRGNVRIESSGYVGYEHSPNFDSLLAKLITHGPTFEGAVVRAVRALEEFHIEGIHTNSSYLLAILKSKTFRTNQAMVTTSFIAKNAESLSVASESGSALIKRHFDISGTHNVLTRSTSIKHQVAPKGAIVAPMQGSIVTVDVQVGDVVTPNQRILVLSAMKMEHEIQSDVAGTVESILCKPNDIVEENTPLAIVVATTDTATLAKGSINRFAVDLDSYSRKDLENVLHRKSILLDSYRPSKVIKRKKRTPNLRTARENINDLVDEGTFVEYGGFAIAQQKSRREHKDLVENTTADGLVGGLASVNSDLFNESESTIDVHELRRRTKCIVMCYDYMVIAGTQGQRNHLKKDKLFQLAEQWKIPVIFFTEGGGGRPGDDAEGAGLDCMAFHLWGRLSGSVPLIGIASGRCFAGNAAILGCCDVVIATKGTNIGMGGPAMIEGGGLGVVSPDEIGPVQEQYEIGTVDILVDDESEAVQVAKQYISYFQGPLKKWSCEDQRLLRTLIPENRLRSYNVRKVIETIADHSSVLELRRGWGPAFVTAFIRVEGLALGVIANNPLHLGGAIDATGSDKAARFMQLCNTFGIPLLFLCDTPGFMVGLDSEREGMVRHCSRLFVVGANLTVPIMTIILRKSYGLGAQAMAGGSHKVPIFVVSWPTGELGGMGLEGAVKLGFKKELESIEDLQLRQETYEKLVAAAYKRGASLNAASSFEIDDVIDPKDSRFLIVRALQSATTRQHPLRNFVDTY